MNVNDKNFRKVQQLIHDIDARKRDIRIFEEMKKENPRGTFQFISNPGKSYQKEHKVLFCDVNKFIDSIIKNLKEEVVYLYKLLNEIK